jgi:outer membrane protein TolC
MKSKLSLIILIVVFFGNLNAQTDSIQTFMFSLSEAQNYALENNYDIKNKQIDIEIAEKQVWQTTAIGLPQVTVSGSWQYIFDVPVMKLEGMGLDSINPFLPFYNVPNDPTSGLNYMLPNYVAYESEIELGTQSNVTFDFMVTQIIFSGEYIVGLQASRVFKSLSEQAVDIAERDLNETIAQSYYLVLAMQQNVEIIDSAYNNVYRIYTEMDAMNKTGFISETDVLQMKLMASTIYNTLLSLKRLQIVSERLLKFQLGLDFEDNLVLTDNIDIIISETDLEAVFLQEFSVQNSLDYKLMLTQEQIAVLSLKREQSKYLPTLAAYYRHQEQLDAPAFNFNPPDVIGASLEWQLFSSGLRNATIQQRKLELAQIQNSKSQVEQLLLLEYDEALNSFSTAYENYLMQKENLLLSDKVRKNTIISYRSGTASSLDIAQTQKQHLEVQATYFDALIELLNAKATLDKLLQ